MLIQSLQPSKHVKGRYLVQLSDQSLLKVTDNEVVAFSLYSGRELGEEELSALKAAATRSNARAQGARMLSARSLSRRELLRRMEEKGTDPQEAQAAADWLEELGLLNDKGYAAAIVRQYSRRGYGRKKLEAELYRRGIDRSLWDEAMIEASPPQEGIRAFLSSRLRGKDPQDPKVLRQVTDALLRRGYSWNQIRQGLSAYTSQLLPEDID